MFLVKFIYAALMMPSSKETLFPYNNFFSGLKAELSELALVHNFVMKISLFLWLSSNFEEFMSCFNIVTNSKLISWDRKLIRMILGSTHCRNSSAIEDCRWRRSRICAHGALRGDESKTNR